MSRREQIAEAIKACEDRAGRAIPKTVVEAARNPSNVLHDEFEWDDSVAAQLQREGRARELIREVRVITIVGERRIATPVYVSDPRTADSAYVQTVVIARSAASKAEVLQAEIGRITTAIERALGLAVVFNLEDRFTTALNEITAASVALGELEDA